jgi:hypothetical protein
MLGDSEDEAPARDSRHDTSAESYFDPATAGTADPTPTAARSHSTSGSPMGEMSVEDAADSEPPSTASEDEEVGDADTSNADGTSDDGSVADTISTLPPADTDDDGMRCIQILDCT